MKHLALITISVFFVINAFSQIVGGRANSEMSPKAVQPTKLTSGAYSGDVNLFTGDYNATINLGSVSTPNGVSFNLNLEYSPTFTVGSTQTISKGIPYGEGWNLNIPTISVESEAFNNFRFQEECDENSSRIGGTALNFMDNNTTNWFKDGSSEKTATYEGDMFWYSPFINIPGVASGRAVLKYIDKLAGHEAVFMLNSFEHPVEIRFDGSTWKVIAEDGTIYTFSDSMHNYSAPSNARMLFYEQGGSQVQAREFESSNSCGDLAPLIENSITPKENYNTWYCSNIYNPNKPYQSIYFKYEKFGKFNYYQEFMQPAYLNASNKLFHPTTFISTAAHNFEAYTDILLTSVEAYSIHSTVNKLVLNYGTDKGVLNVNPEFINFSQVGNGRKDSLYSFQKVYSTNESNRFNGWYRYVHPMRTMANLANNVNVNPYIINGAYQRMPVSGSSVAFDHSFLESERINPNTSFPGDIYELRTLIQRNGSESIRNGNGTLDIAVVTGLSSDNASSGAYSSASFDGTRGIPLFTTSNMALKWTMGYKEHSKQTSNFFVMPDLPTSSEGFNIQIGPGNSDANAGTPEHLIEKMSPSGNVEANAFLSYPWNLSNQMYSLKSSANIPQRFGIGLPWGMMIPVYKMMVTEQNPLFSSGADGTEAFNFWNNPFQSPGPPSRDNIPTKLNDQVHLNEVELIRYSKNPYLLKSVDFYNYNNGEEGFSGLDPEKLVSSKRLEYKTEKTKLLQNYVYEEGQTLITKPNYEQVHVLLKKVIEIPLGNETDTSKLLTTFMEYQNFESGINTKNSLQPYNGFTGKILNLFIDNLGGITKIEYYPITDNRTIISGSISNRRSCPQSATPQKFGDPYVMEIHPIVHYIIKNDEKDLLKNNISLGQGLHKVWEYDFQHANVKGKQKSLRIDHPRFRKESIQQYTYGFTEVKVTEPAFIDASGNSFKNYTVYEHFGNSESNSSLENYLFHGKMKLIKKYDQNGVLYSESKKEYAHTLAFENAFLRPSIMKDRIVEVQKDESPVTDDYEYKDYYHHDILKLKQPGTNIILEGKDAFDFLTCDAITGRGGLRESPKLLEFYFYKYITKDQTKDISFLLNSYFVKQTSEINRDYDDFISKSSTVSNPGGGVGGGIGGVVVNPPLANIADPFGGGTTNPNPGVLVNDLLLTTQATAGPATTATNNLLAATPLSDNVLKSVMNSLVLNEQQKTAILLAQNGLSNTIWKLVIDKMDQFSQSNLLAFINRQTYFSDAVLTHFLAALNYNWDNTIVESMLLKNAYLSYKNMDQLISADLKFSNSGVLAKVLIAQKHQLPASFVTRILNSTVVNPNDLPKILQNQLLTTDQYQQIVNRLDIPNSVIANIIPNQRVFPTDEALKTVLNRVPTLAVDDVVKILSASTTPISDEIAGLIIDTELVIDLGVFITPAGKCGNSNTTSRDYIETRKDFEYYEANYLGISNGNAYKNLMGITDLPNRVVSSSYSGLPNKTIQNLYLKHEPSWQLFRTTTSSVHLPGAVTEEENFYLFDLKNRYDRHWYNYDINEEARYQFEVVDYNSLNLHLPKTDTIAVPLFWDAKSIDNYFDGNYIIPKYEGITLSSQHGLRTLPFQKTTRSKNQTDVKPIERSEYYFYDARWKLDDDLYSLITRPYVTDEECPVVEQDNNECEKCRYYKQPVDENQDQQMLNLLGYKECLWRFTAIGYLICPYSVDARLCDPGYTYLEKVDCRPQIVVGSDGGIGNLGGNPGGNENPSEGPAELLPPSAMLANTLLLRSTVIQVDTIKNILNTEFADKRYDFKNSYIIDFYYQNLNTANSEGYLSNNQVLYPFDTITAERIHKRNEHLQPEIVSNSNGLKTKYYYAKQQHFYNQNATCPAFNFSSLRIKDIGLPIRITVGYGRTDSMGTSYEYNDAGLVSKLINPSGQSFFYSYDGYNRLIKTAENSEERVLSEISYSNWRHNFNLGFYERTNENYVETTIYNDALNTNRPEIQKTFIDPLGREESSAKSYYPSVSDQLPTRIYSGSKVLDNWDRVAQVRKPFKIGNNSTPFNLSSNRNSTDGQMTTLYANDPTNDPLRKADFGVSITRTQTKRYSQQFVNDTYAACELELDALQMRSIMGNGSTANVRFVRESFLDQDNKQTVSYTNSLGQKIATLTYISESSPATTLYLYDSYGNLTKTINPREQETTYKYNLLGQLYLETSVDAGTKRYMYNRLGMISGIQDDSDRPYPTSTPESKLKARYRKLTYDAYGRLLSQKLVSTSLHDDAFAYQTTSYGSSPESLQQDPNGNPRYFRYTFSNRSTQDWVNEYTTYLNTASGDNQPIGTAVVRKGLPTGTELFEKESVYGTDNTAPTQLGKVIRTISYSLSGLPIQDVQFTFDNLEHIVYQRTVQHPTNIADNDFKLVTSEIFYTDYSLRGNLLREVIDIDANGQKDITYQYKYDALNRLSSVHAWKGATEPTNTKLASYTYRDEDNLLVTTRYFGANQQVVQTINHTYDTRYRLKEMNSELFSEELSYDDVIIGNNSLASTVIADRNYNGNINSTRSTYKFGSTTLPSQNNFNLPTIYGYRYDGGNRLTRADAIVGDFMEDYALMPINNRNKLGDEEISYDNIGNITSMTRFKAPTNLVSVNTDREWFSYNYATGTNRLTRASSVGGGTSRNYTYDKNGNLLTDNVRDIIQTKYTRASYAYEITKKLEQINYLYDVNDQRIFKQVTANGQSRTETYIKDAMGRDIAIVPIKVASSDVVNSEYFVFGKERFASIRVQSTTSAELQSNEVTYSLYDHLGNTRVNFQKNTTATPYTILFAGDYFPYGKSLREWRSGANVDRYQTTMHERDDETGLDYRGARYYDSDVARFLSVDPKAAKYPAWSTYNYVMGDPISMIDPDGKDPIKGRIIMAATQEVAAAAAATGFGAPVAVAIEVIGTLWGLYEMVNSIPIPTPKKAAHHATSEGKKEASTKPKEESEAGKRRKNRIPDKGEPNSTKSNESGTTVKKYGEDGNVQKEFNKGHKGPKTPKKETADHVHDYKPNPNHPEGKGTRMPGRPLKKNEMTQFKTN